MGGWDDKATAERPGGWQTARGSERTELEAFAGLGCCCC